jgi:hypothetical protein
MGLVSYMLMYYVLTLKTWCQPSQCSDKLHNADTVQIVTRLQRQPKRVAARHEGGHTQLSRPSVADYDDCLHKTCVGLE